MREMKRKETRKCTSIMNWGGDFSASTRFFFEGVKLWSCVVWIKTTRYSLLSASCWR